MQENEFEDRVQKIMDELSFDPNEAVWTGVAKEIEKDKKRRKPLFWVFLIGVPIIIGAGYLFSTGNFSGRKSVSDRSVSDDSILSNISARKTSRIADSAVSAPEHTALAMNKPASSHTGTGGNNRAGIKSVKVSSEDQVSNTLAENKKKKNGKTAVLVSPESQTPENNAGSEKFNAENAVKPAAASAATMGTNNRSAASTPSVNIPTAVPSKLSDSAAESKKTTAKKEKKSAWSFGLTGNLGVSGTSQPFGNQASVAYGPSSYPGSGGGGSTLVQPSNPAAGFSFSGGAFVQRVLSGRISISGGLSYHYYSTKITVGNLVSNSGSNFNSSLIYSSQSYYTNTGSHSYTNQIHFIELPVLMDFTLNKNKKTPLIWEAGFSFAYLLSSDYLYFDPYAKVYYKNDGVLKKDQWNLSTALMIGWKMHNSRFLLGPQVQYGISGLLNSSQAYSQYLYSFGLKFSFIPGGK